LAGARYLIVTADDFGIGPATTKGILDLSEAGLVTGSVLLVNSPYAVEAVQAWQEQGRRLELGWHPCLTLDLPVAPAATVRSLINANGRFWSLGAFIRKLLLGRIQTDEVETELRAQYASCTKLLGHAPTVVNFHHHLQVFPAIGAILRRVLADQNPLPYVRRIRESWSTTLRIPGARLKRLFLSSLGRQEFKRQADDGFPGNDWLAGITDPSCVEDPDFLARWLRRVPGEIVELTCHPGYGDQTLIGRDSTGHDGLIGRRVSELRLLQHPSFKNEFRRAGFQLVAPSEVIRSAKRAPAVAA
jgi:predicted glycoside hydrolase/deacetylase ChbG (UPF0249 family)